MRQVPVRLEAVSVHQKSLRTNGQLVECPVHGKERSVEDIDFVDFLRRDDTYGPCQCVPLYLFAQQIPLLFAQLFGVVEHLIAVIFRQDDRRGVHCPGQAAAPSLVKTGLCHIWIQIR